MKDSLDLLLSGAGFFGAASGIALAIKIRAPASIFTITLAAIFCVADLGIAMLVCLIFGEPIVGAFTFSAPAKSSTIAIQIGLGYGLLCVSIYYLLAYLMRSAKVENLKQIKK